MLSTQNLLPLCSIHGDESQGLLQLSWHLHVLPAAPVSRFSIAIVTDSGGDNIEVTRYKLSLNSSYLSRLLGRVRASKLLVREARKPNGAHARLDLSCTEAINWSWLSAAIMFSQPFLNIRYGN
ncbi:hypothetical protein Tco_0813617 [Tanacetum coccineum]